MIKVLIVDNELLAGVRIERLLTTMQNIIFVGQATIEVQLWLWLKHRHQMLC